MQRETEIYYEYLITLDGLPPDQTQETLYWPISKHEGFTMCETFRPAWPHVSLWSRKTSKLYYQWNPVDTTSSPTRYRYMH